MSITVREIGTFKCEGCGVSREVNPYDVDGAYRLAIEPHGGVNCTLEAFRWYIICEACAARVLAVLRNPG